jgi:hypothetical protein
VNDEYKSKTMETTNKTQTTNESNQNNPTPGTPTIADMPQKKKRKQPFELSDEDESDLNFARFFIIKTTDGLPMKYNIFAIQKFLQCGIGDVKVAKKLANGTILVEVSSKEQALKAIKMTKWFDTPISVTPHRSLNSCRGVIRCRELRDCDDTEVLAALGPQGVVEVKHILTKRNEKLEPTNTFILTFKTPTPPKSVKIAYMNVSVDLYIPNPLRCYKCQRFGHGKNACNRNPVCAKCGQEGHDDTACQAPMHCANCSGTHAAFSKECSHWSKQKEITQLKFEKNISFFEARQIVEQRTKKTAAPTGATGATRAGVLYSRAGVKTSEAATQTELTWPLDSKMPVSVANVLPKKDVSSCISQTETPPKTLDKQLGKVPKKFNSLAIAQSRKPGPASSKAGSNRSRKGANDPVGQFNRFGPLDDVGAGDVEGDDDMEYQVIRSKSSSPKKKSK